MSMNIDIICAQRGQELAEINEMKEKILNAALTVLEEQGPYAMFLYLKAHQQKKGIYERFENCCRALFRDVLPDTQKPGSEQSLLEWLAKISETLDDLLFVREILISMLSYARYHLKSKSETGKTDEAS